MLTHAIPLNTESLANSPMASDHQQIGCWTYFTYDVTDEDTVHKYGHFVVHQDTGEERMIAWDSYGLIPINDLWCLCEMGWPERAPSGGSWDSAWVGAAYCYFNTTKSEPWFGSRWMLALIAAAAVLVGVML